MILDFCNGGSSETVARLESALDRWMDLPLCASSPCFLSASSAYNSSASVRIFASSESSAMAWLYKYVFASRREIWPRSGPADADRAGARCLFFRAGEEGDRRNGTELGAVTAWDRGIGRGLVRSGLAGRSLTGRGDSGTFQRLASSGNSSSESLYSSSSSLTLLRRPIPEDDCLILDPDGEEGLAGCDGDGDRDRAGRNGSDGLDAFGPTRRRLPDARLGSNDFCAKVPKSWGLRPCDDDCVPFWPEVRSRNKCGAELEFLLPNWCDLLVDPAYEKESWLVACKSSASPISSKLDTSVKLASWSDACDDRKDVDFEDLEPESSGGELTEATVIVVAISVVSLQRLEAWARCSPVQL